MADRATLMGRGSISAISKAPSTASLYLSKTANLSDLDDVATAVANLGLTIGTQVQAHDSDLDAIAALATTGLIARTGAGTAAARTITGESGVISVSNGDGVSGNPALSLDANGIGLTKLLQVATGTVLGRSSASTGNLEVLSTLPTGVQDNITRLGTIASGAWNGTKVAEAYGGTNQSTYTTGDLLQATASNTLGKLAAVATGNALISGGVGTASSWGKIGLTTHVSGTLGAGNGGTGLSSVGSAGQVIRSTGSVFAMSTLKVMDTTADQSVIFSDGANNLSTDSTFLFNKAASPGATLQVPTVKAGKEGVADHTAWFLASGITRAIRFGTNTTGGVLEGVDQTGTASYQPIIVGGSEVRLHNNNTTYYRSVSGKSFFGGTTSASALIEMAAGSTSIAPLRFTLGSAALLSSPITGALEAISDKLHYTISTSTARKEVTLNDAALTSGRLPGVTTNGRLIDYSGGTWDGTTITADKLKSNAANPDVSGVWIEAATGTNAAAMKFTNTGGNSFLGMDGSGGNRIQNGGAVAYAMCLWSESNNPIIFGVNNVEQVRFTSGTALFPQVGTTANPANAYLDNGASNSLLRSTSSLVYKRVLGPLTIEEAGDLIDGAEPIRYQSKSSRDNWLTEHVGFAAEQIAKIDDRFVTRRRDSSPDWVQYSQFAAPLALVAKDLRARLARVERALNLN